MYSLAEHADELIQYFKTVSEEELNRILKSRGYDFEVRRLTEEEKVENYKIYIENC